MTNLEQSGMRIPEPEIKTAEMASEITVILRKFEE